MNLQNTLEYRVFVAFSFLFRIVGLKAARKGAYLLALFFFYLLPIRKQVVIDNLKKALPLLPDSKINRLAFESYYSFAVALAEILSVPSLTAEQIKEQVIIENPEFIRSRYKEGKGLILTTAHFGNWEFAALGVGLHLGIPLSVIVKSQRNPLVNDWMNINRVKWGNRVVPLGASIRNIYAELKNKNIIALVGDQRGPREGERVQFMGLPTVVYTGGAALALKTGAPLLCGMMVRQDDGKYVFEMQEIEKGGLKGDEREQVLELTQRYFTVLEDFVYKYPGHWLWMHNRWKY